MNGWNRKAEPAFSNFTSKQLTECPVKELYRGYSGSSRNGMKSAYGYVTMDWINKRGDYEQEEYGDEMEVRPVFAIAERNGKSYWIRIGGATFENQDGSETVLLDALPVKGQMQIRTA